MSDDKGYIIELNKSNLSGYITKAIRFYNGILCPESHATRLRKEYAFGAIKALKDLSHAFDTSGGGVSDDES